MSGPRIDVVTRFGRNTASVTNLKQSLDTLSEYTVHLHCPRIELPGREYRGKYLFENSLMIPRFVKIFFQLKEISDVLIIHKTLFPREWGGLERLFLRCNNVVYSTYDAEYVRTPKKVEMLFERSEVVVATSHAIARSAEAATDDVVLIPPSVDTEFFKPIPRADVAYPGYEPVDDGLTLGWVGSADEHAENLSHLVDCLRSIPGGYSVTVRFLGNGEFTAKSRAPFEELAQDRPHISVDFVDRVPRELVPDVINSFDIGLTPMVDSPFERGRSSEKTREYMACGLPVVGSDVGENPHLVPESAGVLLSSPDEWGPAIASLAESPDKLSQMGRAAREHAESHYSIGVTSERFRDLFSKLETDDF